MLTGVFVCCAYVVRTRTGVSQLWLAPSSLLFFFFPVCGNPSRQLQLEAGFDVLTIADPLGGELLLRADEVTKTTGRTALGNRCGGTELQSCQLELGTKSQSWHIVPSR